MDEEPRLTVLMLARFFTTPRDFGGAYRTWIMSRRLAHSGHDTYVLVPGLNPGFTSRKTKRAENMTGVYKSSTVDGVHVLETRVPQQNRSSLVSRIFYMLMEAIVPFYVGLKLPKPDVVVANQPLPRAVAGYLLSVFRGAEFVFEVQEFITEGAIKAGVVRPGLVTSILLAIERWLYKRADFIIALSPGIAQWIIDKEIDQDKIVVVENGYEPELFEEAADYSTDVRQEFGWQGKFIVLYIGAMGLYSELGPVLRAAKLVMEDYEDIQFVFVGDGQRREEYQSFAEEHNLTNCHFEPPHLKREMPAFCRAADVCLNVLPPDPYWGKIIWSTKQFDYMGSARPTIAAVPGGDIGDLIERSNGGIVISPDDHTAMREAILSLYRDRAAARQMGQSAFEYVVEHLHSSQLAERYHRALLKVAD